MWVVDVPRQKRVGRPSKIWQMSDRLSKKATETWMRDLCISWMNLPTQQFPLNEREPNPWMHHGCVSKKRKQINGNGRAAKEQGRWHRMWVAYWMEHIFLNGQNCSPPNRVKDFVGFLPSYIEISWNHVVRFLYQMIVLADWCVRENIGD